ncbi:Wzt carbohydrate-binding domain-containing protein [Bosea minatitlanensis]|uniref:Wzt carbohydrate-binding domain-containing protein n=1 Tax=Bosea minatitlanensis TaxID=128782 RepID=A0ABW0FBY3_9HYPH|nr:Wzt carbohydrate-binding domain-containing protein [Bosea minatitlanensis]MCT4493012.1 Wzt carbohydrate-binding domain-containing protein [Bosea minatitlanensis]
MNAPEPAIRARKLRKAYRHYASPIDPLLEIVRGVPRHTEQVALRSIDLEIKRGEIVGILGRNGAGKSTLLKIIAGTLERTSGDLDINGRITAILELGTGFHPDYTGRENIFMGGLCLGMTRIEIDRKIDSIIDFSELRDVIDQPFKTYSTGMQARLTFSTAISVDPDILIVDEALSVGDARFQMKCFGWIQQLKKKGATVLLVSHDTNTITTFCDRAMILENGAVFAEGDAKPMTVLYHNLLFGQSPAAKQPENTTLESVSIPDAAPPPAGSPSEATLVTENTPIAALTPQAAQTQAPSPSSSQATGARYGSGEAELLDWGLVDGQDRDMPIVASGARFRLKMRLACREDIQDLSFGFAIKDRKGTVVWGKTNLTATQQAYSAHSGDVLTVTCDGTMWLAAGDYFVTLGAARLADGTKIDFIEDALQFRVVGTTGIFTTSIVNLDSTLAVVAASTMDQGKPAAEALT